jgi:WD40 repeat protein
MHFENKQYTPLTFHHLKSIEHTHSIIEHTDEVTSFLLLNDGRFATGSRDRSIKIHKISSDCSHHETVITIANSHDHDVINLCQLSNGTLVSCGNDYVIKLWKLTDTSYEHLAVLKGHEDCVYKVTALTHNRIASTSCDLTLHIWNGVAPYNELTVLRGHTEWVKTCIQLRNREVLVSCSFPGEHSFKTWDLNTYECINTIEDADSTNRSALKELDNGLVVTGGFGRICIVDVDAGVKVKEIRHEFFGDWEMIMSILDIGGCIMVGCYQGRIAQVDLDKGEVLFKKENIHKLHVIAMEVINKGQTFATTAFHNNEVKIWKYCLE